MSDNFFEPFFCFDGANLIDKIRQKVIDIKNDPSLEEITYFLGGSCKYLENDLPPDVATELYSAILSLFTEYTKELLSIFNDILNKSRTNGNYIYMTSLLISYLKYIDLEFNVPDYSPFINDAINQISQQITNQSENFIIFGHAIAPQFKNYFILNTALSSTLTEEISSKLFHHLFYHFWQKNDKKFDLFLLYVIKSGLNTILPQTQSSNEEILEFLLTKDDQIFLKMSEESFSIIKSAIIILKHPLQEQIKGLNEQTVIQFTAIVFALLSFNSNFTHFLFNNEFNWKKVHISLKSNEILYKFTDFILTNFPLLYKKQFLGLIPRWSAFFNTLINQLIDNEYEGDIFLLLNVYINYFSDKNNSKTLLSLFSYIFLERIYQFPMDFVYRSFDLKLINKNIIQLGFLNIESEEEAAEKIYFFSKVCFNQLLMPCSFEMLEILMEAFNHEVQNKKYKNALLICQFLQQNILEEETSKIRYMKDLPLIIRHSVFYEKLNENEDVEIDELFYNIIATDDFESHQYFLLKLFRIMLNDEDNLFCYLSYLVSQSNCGYIVQPYFKYFYNEYCQYHDVFLKVTNELFTYVSSGNALNIRNNFKPENYKISKMGSSIISKLFALLKENPLCNYQVFLCLKSIACTVPILFNSNIQQIFDSILEPFNNLYLLFEKILKNEKTFLYTQTAYASLSFLLSTFQSSLVLDHFLRWLFDNFEKFSNSQIYGFIYILRCLSDASNVFNSIIPSLYIKYNIFDKVATLLKRKITEGSNFENNFKENIFSFLESVFHSFDEYTNYVMCQNEMLSQVENKFTYFYSNIFSSFIKYSHLQIKVIDDRIDDFIQFVDSDRDFWINFDIHSRNTYFDCGHLEKFCQELPSHEPFIVPKNDRILNKPISIRMAKYLSMKPFFIYDSIIHNKDCVYSEKEGLLYIETMNKLREMQKQALESPQDEDDSDIETFNKIDYFAPFINHPEFIENLVNQIAIPGIDKKYLIKVFQYMTAYPIVNKKIIEFINLKITELADDPSSLAMLIEELKNRLFNNNNFIGTFFELYGNNFINAVLSPKCRNDTQLMKNVAEFLSLLNMKLPIRVTHIICFLILMNSDELILSALKLCRYFDYKELVAVNDLLLDLLDQKCFKVDSFDYILFNEIVNYVPSILNTRKAELISLLSKEFDNYANSNDKKLSFNHICTLLNVTAPNRSDSTTLSNVIDLSTKIPAFIKETGPIFWDFYEEHMAFINEKLADNPFLLDKELKFLLNYPEIVDFKIRSAYFKKKMKKRINKFESLNFTIDFDKLLETSFQALHDESPENLLKYFHIKVENSPAIDLGGVTRTWFTLLAKKLFNQNYGIFDCSKKMCYMPNRNSFIHENHLEYFKFAGIFIARALIERINIDAHLTKSFYKQILHRKTSLKDLEDIDDDMYRSSKLILENDANALELTFSMNFVDFGEIKTIELKENGSKIPVTNENKVEFINLRTNYILNTQIQEQIDAFSSGFDSLLPHEFLRIFTPNELDLLICGVPSIDVNDFIENITFKYPYNENTPVVKLFFEVIQNWNDEDLAKLLQFMTGTARVPLNGLKEFAEITGHRLKIGPGGERTNWPQARTCFNELDLPEYQTKEELETLLRRSIEYNDSFGFI